jgi:hypothetical protein
VGRITQKQQDKGYKHYIAMFLFSFELLTYTINIRKHSSTVGHFHPAVVIALLKIVI